MNLTKFAEAIIDSRKGIRRKEVVILKQLDADIVAAKTFQALIRFLDGNQKLTYFSGTLGKSILNGLEDMNDPERIINKRRIAIGLHIVRILKNNKILDIYRSKEDGTYYLKPSTTDQTITTRVKIRGVIKDVEQSAQISEFFNDLMMQLNGANLSGFDRLEAISHKRPVFYPPNERTSFFQADQGQLVSNVHKSRVNEFAISKVPMLYDTINTLQAVKYEINSGVLDVANVLRETDLMNYSDIEPSRRIGKLREQNVVIDTANWCSTSSFYLHWYCGPRGRTYCSSDYFNPQGCKLAKSLFYFSNGEALGVSGWNELLKHTANSIGFDKLYPAEKLAIVEDNLELINEVFKNPIDNKWWWSTLDSPFESLAAGMEIYAATDSGNEYEFISGLPIGLDCSTSAFQFIGGMLKDPELCRLSNLTDNHELGDAYIHVANDVWIELESNTNPHAKFWIKHFNNRRSICKRSVMTYGYTAGPATMGSNVYDDHRDKINGVTVAQCNFLGRLIYKSCVKMFPAIAGFMDLINYVAKIQGKSGNDYGFISPLSGFPFMQNYRHSKKGTIEFQDGNRKIKLKYIMERDVTVRLKKVASSSPANTVHSTDKELVIGVTQLMKEHPFFTVHDCFFTIPSRVAEMSIMSRQCMVDIFNDDLLREYVIQNNCDHLIIDGGFKYQDYNGRWTELMYGNQDVTELIDNPFCIA